MGRAQPRAVPFDTTAASHETIMNLAGRCVDLDPAAVMSWCLISLFSQCAMETAILMEVHITTCKERSPGSYLRSLSCVPVLVTSPHHLGLAYAGREMFLLHSRGSFTAAAASHPGGHSRQRHAGGCLAVDFLKSYSKIFEVAACSGSAVVWVQALHLV